MITRLPYPLLRVKVMPEAIEGLGADHLTAPRLHPIQRPPTVPDLRKMDWTPSLVALTEGPKGRRTP